MRPLAVWAVVPMRPGARGNVDTHAVHDALTAAGWHTGLDMAALDRAGQIMQRIAAAAATNTEQGTGDD